MIIVTDTSALYDACGAARVEHSAAVTIMEDETLAISPLVVAELDHLLRPQISE